MLRQSLCTLPLFCLLCLLIFAKLEIHFNNKKTAGYDRFCVGEGRIPDHLTANLLTVPKK